MFIVFNRNMLLVAKAAYDISTSVVLPPLYAENLPAAFRIAVFPL